MKSNPLAKINLGLNIISKRPDGYHNLETVFYPINITDTLTVEAAPELDVPYEFQTNLEFTPNPEDNLVIKALNAMKNITDIPPVKINLEKNIPTGAGLGGGSSDAAYMLRMLREMFCPEVSDEKLIEIASGLGADCAFFIKSEPVYAEGIGDIMSQYNICISDYHIVVIKPNVSVPTKEAYAGINPKMPETNIRDILKLQVNEWKGLLINDFEHHIFKIHPEIEQIKTHLYTLGAEYASMSGSGASVFGIFRNKPDFGKEEFPGCFFWKQSL